MHTNSSGPEPSSTEDKKVKMKTGHSEHLSRYISSLRDFKATNEYDVDLEDHKKLLSVHYEDLNPMLWSGKFPVSAKRKLVLEESAWMPPIYNFHSEPEPDLNFDDESYTDDGAISPIKMGPTALAFLFQQGIIVAVDRSELTSDSGKSEPELATGKIIKFNPRVIGCITGEVADVELFYKDLPPQGIRGTVKEVSERLAHSLSSHSVKGVSGILIAGWDARGHHLCGVDGKGNLFMGESIACGSCSKYAIKILNVKNHYYMSYLEAASNFANDEEASESDESDESVSVFWIGFRGFMAGIN